MPPFAPSSLFLSGQFGARVGLDLIFLNFTMLALGRRSCLLLNRKLSKIPNLMPSSQQQSNGNRMNQLLMFMFALLTTHSILFSQKKTSCRNLNFPCPIQRILSAAWITLQLKSYLSYIMVGGGRNLGGSLDATPAKTKCLFLSSSTWMEYLLMLMVVFPSHP